MKHNYSNPPQITMLLFVVVLLAAAPIIDTSMAGITNGALIKWAMSGVIVLSLIPIINVGTGRNFGMSIGLSAGFVGVTSSVNAGYTSWTGFFYSVFLGIAVVLLSGYLYAKILNHLKLNEEIVGTFTGHSFIPVMSLLYTFAPVTNHQMLYPIGGQGLRPKVNLEPYFDQALDRPWQVRMEELVILAGLLLFFFGTGFLLWLFLKTGVGMIFSAIAENERFVRLADINVNGYRIVVTIASTVIVAAGVVAYSQSYEILHLYDGPFVMSFPAASVTIIGGASLREATVANVLTGTSLYQTIYLLFIPVANALLIPEMAGIMRTITTNEITLYVFIFERKGMRNETR